MKNLKTTMLLCAATLLIAVSACKKEDTTPTQTTTTTTGSNLTTAEPNFTFSGNNLAAPSNVLFTNTSVTVGSYYWDFGDANDTVGVYSTNASHVYTQGGTYVVTLYAVGEDQKLVSKQKTVTVAANYTKCTITKMSVTQIPFTDANGIGWDVSPIASGPDVYYILQDINGTGLLPKSSVFNDLTPSQLPISWLSVGQISNLTPFYFFHFYDADDVGNDDDMSYVSFHPSAYISYPTAYPSTINLSQNGINITLTLSWE